MSKRLEIENIRKLVEDNGSKLLSEKYINNSTKLDVICPDGHLYHPTAK